MLPLRERIGQSGGSDVNEKVLANALDLIEESILSVLNRSARP